VVSRARYRGSTWRRDRSADIDLQVPSSAISVSIDYRPTVSVSPPGGRNWVRTSDPSLVRRNPAVAGRRLTSPEVPASWTNRRRASPSVARRLRPLAPCLAPQDLVSDANVRTLGGCALVGAVRRGCHSNARGQGNGLDCRAAARPAVSEVRAVKRHDRALLRPVDSMLARRQFTCQDLWMASGSRCGGA
jgi:hypothetical protein